jgi:hypothetical protein
MLVLPLPRPSVEYTSLSRQRKRKFIHDTLDLGFKVEDVPRYRSRQRPAEAFIHGDVRA